MHSVVSSSRFSVETTSTITSLKPRKKIYTKKKVPRVSLCWFYCHCVIVFKTVEHVNEHNDHIHHVRDNVGCLYATADCDSQYGCVTLSNFTSLSLLLNKK